MYRNAEQEKRDLIARLRAKVEAIEPWQDYWANRAVMRTKADVLSILDQEKQDQIAPWERSDKWSAELWFGDYKVTGNKTGWCVSNVNTGKYLELGSGKDPRFYDSLADVLSILDREGTESGK